MAMKSVLAEYYNKGEIKVKDRDPREEFKDLPDNTIIVKVKRGSKVRNIMGFVEKSFKEEKNTHMIFTGCGDAIEKTITCVEIAKTKFKYFIPFFKGLTSDNKVEFTKCCKPHQTEQQTVLASCYQFDMAGVEYFVQKVEEYWDPTKPDLDKLQVTREIPMISILLSKNILDANELGYQGPVDSKISRKVGKRKKTQHGQSHPTEKLVKGVE